MTRARLMEGVLLVSTTLRKAGYAVPEAAQIALAWLKTVHQMCDAEAKAEIELQVTALLHQLKGQKGD